MKENGYHSKARFIVAEEFDVVMVSNVEVQTQTSMSPRKPVVRERFLNRGA